MARTDADAQSQLHCAASSESSSPENPELLTALSQRWHTLFGKDRRGEAIGERLRRIFDLSQASRRGITVHVNGQALSGYVVEHGDDWLLLASHAHGHTLVRLCALDAVVMP